MLAEDPSLGDLDVIYASDDEGNSFHIVHNGPEECFFDREERNAIFDQEDIEEACGTINAICIN